MRHTALALSHDAKCWLWIRTENPDFQDGLIDKIISRNGSYASADRAAARRAADAGKLRPGGYPVVWGYWGQFSNSGTLEQHAATHFPVAGLGPNHG